MLKIRRLTPQFVDSFPDTFQGGTLYLSVRFRTAAHLCCCGCGTKVVTPIRPTDWSFSYNGEDISLHPSIGNWSIPCRSHYWVRQGRVQLADDWSEERISKNRLADRENKAEYFNGGNEAGETTDSTGASSSQIPSVSLPSDALPPKHDFWLKRLVKRIFG